MRFHLQPNSLPRHPTLAPERLNAPATSLSSTAEHCNYASSLTHSLVDRKALHSPRGINQSGPPFYAHTLWCLFWLFMSLVGSSCFLAVFQTGESVKELSCYR